MHDLAEGFALPISSASVAPWKMDLCGFFLGQKSVYSLPCSGNPTQLVSSQSQPHSCLLACSPFSQKLSAGGPTCLGVSPQIRRREAPAARPYFWQSKQFFRDSILTDQGGHQLVESYTDYSGRDGP